MIKVVHYNESAAGGDGVATVPSLTKLRAAS